MARQDDERNRGDREVRGALTTMVCISCGNEEFFEAAVPDTLSCDKCGGTVFRQFTTPTEPDDATIAQLEDTARSIQYGDSSPQTSPDEIRDLDAR
jgi:ribosomal protein S27E